MLREVLDAVEEQGEINAGKGEKKYIRHITPEQAEQEIRGMIEGMKEEYEHNELCPCDICRDTFHANLKLSDITEKLFGEGKE